MNTHKSVTRRNRKPDAAAAPPDELLTPSEVAAILKLSETAVTKRIARGLIPAVRLGDRGYRVKRSVLDAYLAQLPEV